MAAIGGNIPGNQPSNLKSGIQEPQEIEATDIGQQQQAPKASNAQQIEEITAQESDPVEQEFSDEARLESFGGLIEEPGEGAQPQLVGDEQIVEGPEQSFAKQFAVSLGTTLGDQVGAWGQMYGEENVKVNASGEVFISQDEGNTFVAANKAGFTAGDLAKYGGITLEAALNFGLDAKAIAEGLTGVGLPVAVATFATAGAVATGIRKVGFAHIFDRVEMENSIIEESLFSGLISGITGGVGNLLFKGGKSAIKAGEAGGGTLKEAGVKAIKEGFKNPKAQSFEVNKSIQQIANRLNVENGIDPKTFLKEGEDAFKNVLSKELFGEGSKKVGGRFADGYFSRASTRLSIEVDSAVESAQASAEFLSAGGVMPNAMAQTEKILREKMVKEGFEASGDIFKVTDKVLTRKPFGSRNVNELKEIVQLHKDLVVGEAKMGGLSPRSVHRNTKFIQAMGFNKDATKGVKAYFAELSEVASKERTDLVKGLISGDEAEAFAKVMSDNHKFIGTLKKLGRAMDKEPKFVEKAHKMIPSHNVDELVNLKNLIVAEGGRKGNVRWEKVRANWINELFENSKFPSGAFSADKLIKNTSRTALDPSTLDFMLGKGGRKNLESLSGQLERLNAGDIANPKVQSLLVRSLKFMGLSNGLASGTAKWQWINDALNVNPEMAKWLAGPGKLKLIEVTTTPGERAAANQFANDVASVIKSKIPHKLETAAERLTKLVTTKAGKRTKSGRLRRKLTELTPAEVVTTAASEGIRELEREEVRLQTANPITEGQRILPAKVAKQKRRERREKKFSESVRR